MSGYFIVFIGGGIGAALRHGVNRAALSLLGPSLPYGTLFVNVIGGFLMGAVAELLLRNAGLSEGSRLFVTTGFLGGFTTFSACLRALAGYRSLAAYSPRLGKVMGPVSRTYTGRSGDRHCLKPASIP